MCAADTLECKHGCVCIQNPGLDKAAEAAVLEDCWSRLGKTSQAQRKLLLGFLLPPQEPGKQQNSHS